MRIAFISGNQEKLPDAVIPLGLLTILAATPDHHTKVLWDLNFEPDIESFLAPRLRDFQPDLIAVGMRNLQNNDYSNISDNLDHYGRIFQILRAHSSAPVAIGGGGFSVMAAGLMAELKADYGIAGEGERTFNLLVASLEAGTPPAGEVIAGLHYFHDGALISGPTAPRVDLATLPMPDRSLLDPRYYTRDAIDSVQTHRGCPLHCTYCTYPLIEGRKLRRRTPEQVADEIALMQRQQPGVQHFFITDAVFNLPPRHAKEVCRELIKRGNTLPWTCYTNPLGFDAELAELMVAAGCAGTEVGADSGTDAVLKRLRKGFDTATVLRFHDMAQAAGLRDCHTFILGTPGETMADVHETLAFVERLRPFAAILMIWIDDQEALAPELRQERAALRDEIKALLQAGFADNPRWIIPPLGANFDLAQFEHLRALGLQGPLWQHIDLIPERSPQRRRRLGRRRLGRRRLGRRGALAEASAEQA